MANAITYIKNVGKSVGYASFDVVKEMTPVFSDFAETNGQLMTDMYKSLRSLKIKSRKLPKYILDSEYGKFGKTYLDNLVSDIQTGKFYNKERKDKYEQEAANAMMGMDDSDFGFDFNDSSDGFNFDDMDSFDGEISTNDMMDIVGEKTSNAISNTLARSAEYIVQGTAESNKTIYNQMSTIYGGLHTGLSTINQNISKILEFHDQGTMTHYENSRTFYEESTRSNQERNQYLREISETLKSINGPDTNTTNKYTKAEYKKNTYSDMVTYEGALDLSNYAQNIKKNLKDKTGGLYDMLNMVVEQGMLKTFAASPLEGLAKLIVTSVIPTTIEKSVENLNKSLSGMVGNALMGLKDKAKESSVWETISEIFGVNTSIQTKIDPSKYERGKIPFDGITKKAIVEVIPTYLAKILAAVSGTPENRFNYETGKFVTIDELRDEYKSIAVNSANRAAYGIDSVVRDKTRKLGWDEKRQKQFDDDWQAIKEYMFNNQKNFNTRDKSLRGNTFGLKGGMASDVNVRLLQTILDGNPEMLRYADQMFKEIDTHNRRMVDLQNAGTMTALENGSIPKTDKTPVSGTSPVSIAASANNTILSELTAIHKELSFIRIYGTGKSLSKKDKGGSRPNFDNFNIPDIRTGNYNDYDKNLNKVVSDSTQNVDDETLNKEVVDILKSGKEETISTSKNATKSFSERMHEASGLSAKMSVLVKSATDLAKKPAEFVVAMMDKADARLYDLIYGPKDDKEGKKSFIGKLFKGLEKMFDKFSDFITEKILDPLKEKLSGDKIKNFFKGAFEKIFKKSFDEVFDNVKKRLFGEKGEDGKRSEDSIFGKFINDFKSEMKGAKDWVKKSFKEAGDWSGVTSEKNEQGQAKQERNDAINNEISKFQDILKRSVSQTTEAATGIKRVENTGLAVISEGEMIVPPDMNPFNVTKRQRGEKKVKDKLKDGIDSIFEFATGTPKVEISDEQRTKNNATKARIASEKIKKLKSQKESFTREDFERLPFGTRVLDEGERLINTLRKSADMMEISEEDKKKFKENSLNFIGKLKDYGGTMAAGATIGAGVSLFTGLLGGPLVGAAVGAGIGLIKRSETVQNMLFGELKDGERQGGLISKELSNNIHKYLPDMAKGATVGSILTALPIVPGGPVAGLIIGSALGFAKNNEQVQDALFGEGKLLGKKEDFQKKVRSVLPKMGLGAAVGLLAGPFGLTTNILLGSALGFASDSNKFKDLMFGEADKNGKRNGGIFGAIVNPAKEFFGNMYSEFKDFIKTKMFQPLADAIAPLKKQFELMSESIMNHFKESFKMHIGAPIARLVEEKIINPIGKKLGGIFNFLMKPLKALISAPFQLVGAVGNKLRDKQVKAGNADYMTAAQRNAWRKSRGDLRMMGDKYAEFDQSLENASPETIAALKEGLEGIRGSRNSVKRAAKESFDNVRTVLYNDKNIDLNISKTALQILKNGDYEQAQKFIKDSNIPEESKFKALQSLIKESAKLKVTQQMKKNADATADQMAAKFQEMGVKIDPAILKGLAKGDKEAEKVYKYVVGEDKANEAQNQSDIKVQQRHDEITNILEEIRDILKRAKGETDPNDKRYEEDIENLQKRYNFVSGTSDNPEDETAADPEKGSLISSYRIGKYKAKEYIKGKVKQGKALTKKASENVKGLARDIRNTDTMNAVFGDRNTDWRSTRENTLVKDISNNIKKLLGVTVAEARINGTDVPVSENDVNSTNYLDKVKNKFKNGKQTITQFFDGHAVEFFKKRNGSYERKQTSDNKEYDKEQEEKKKRENGILGALTSMPSMLGNLFGKLFGKKDDDEKSWISKLIEKVAAPAKIALAVAGAFGVAGWAKEKIFPGLKVFWDEKVVPYLSDSWQGKNKGFGQFIYLFNPENPNGLLAKFKEYFPKIMKTVSTYISTGMNWALREVLPTVVSTLVKNLPVILKSVATGLLDGLNELLFNKGKKNDGKMADLDNIESQLGMSSPFSNMSSSSTPSWFDKSVQTQEKLQDGETLKLSSSSGNKTVASRITEEINAKVSNSTVPKAFDTMNQVYRESALKEYEKVKSNVIDTPYGKMAVSDILNSDKQFATNTETGDPIYGYELLNYNNTAQQLGMNIQLSEDELRANTLAQGGGGKTTVQGKLGAATLRSLARGLVGNSTGITRGAKFVEGGLGLIGKTVKLLPGIGKPIGSAIEGIGKVVSGGIKLPNTIGKKIAGKAANAAGDVVTEVAENASSGTFRKFIKSASNSKLGKFISIVCEGIKGLFKDSKVATLISKAIIHVKGKTSKNVIQNGIEKFGDFLVSKLPKILDSYGGKIGKKAAIKLGAYTASAATLLVADAVISFVYGYNNANTILGITQEPDLPYKVLCGILEALNSVFCLGLVPLNILVDLVVSGSKLIGLNGFDNLEKQRKLAKEEVEKFNKENGTDFDVEEYNKRDSLGTKVKNALSSVGNWFKNLFGKKDNVDTTSTSVDKPTSAASYYIQSQNSDASNIPSYAASSGRGSGLFVGRASNINSSTGTFISQLDSKYRNKQFNISGDTQRQTLGDTGCAPAAAAMAINSSLGNKFATMEDSSRNALRYKVKNDGVDATYFGNEFARYGMDAQYIASNNMETRGREILAQLMQNNKVILMGEDGTNISKLNSPFGPNPHYVVANGLSKDGKSIYINDPESTVPNVKYDTSKILASSKLGIATGVARGSKAITNKIRRMVGRGTLPGIDNAEKCWNYFRSQGFSEEATAGILGNLKAESGLDPTILQNGKGPAAGICQWETYNDYNSRWGRMAKNAESKGRNWTDLESQLEFLISELPSQFKEYTGRKVHTYSNGTQTWWPTKVTIEEYKKMTNISDTTQIFERVVLRPSIPHREKRLQYAKEFYSRFTGTPITDIATTSSGSDTSSTTTSSSNPFLEKMNSVITGLAEAWGIITPQSSSSDSTSSGSASGNVSANSDHAEQQKALVNLMYSKEGQLKYSNTQRDPEKGSADCSSLVQWAYKKILDGVDPGSTTAAQRTDSDTYTVATNDWTEDDLQLGDLLLKQNPGHVEMYAGNGKMIGHGGGLNGTTNGPVVSNLGKPSTYSLVRRWTGFKGSGSGLVGRGTDTSTYDNALKYINPEQYTSLFPVEYDNENIDKTKLSITKYSNGNDKVSDNIVKSINSTVYRGATNVTPNTVSDKYNRDIIELVKSIIRLLTAVVTNTDQLNNIAKLLGQYITTVGSSDGSKESKQATLLAKQNLLNAMQSGGGNSSEPNAQLLALIEAAEKIARE